jgi:1-phosphofructokinase family hexose kinase
MILAAGLTPAWQQILEFERFVPGEVNRASAAHWCGSGKVLNVGRALAALVAQTEFERATADSDKPRCLTFAPLGGIAAAAIAAEFARDCVPLRSFPTTSSTRVCTTLINRGTNSVTELVENARPLPPLELTAYAAQFQKLAAAATVVVLSGSLPAETPHEYYASLLQAYQGKIVLDARGAELLAALPIKPWFVKPNRAELAKTSSFAISSAHDLLHAMRELNQAGAEWVAVSAGAEALWLTSQEEIYRFHPPRLDKVINPIGSGDSLAAGIALGAALGWSAVESVRLGIAAAAANAETLLPARWEPGRVIELLAQVELAHVANP